MSNFRYVLVGIAIRNKAPLSLLSPELTSGVGSLEERIGALRQELEKRREEVRRARGEQRERKRALLRDEENRLRRRLEVRDTTVTDLS